MLQFFSWLKLGLDQKKKNGQEIYCTEIMNNIFTVHVPYTNPLQAINNYCCYRTYASILVSAMIILMTCRSEVDFFTMYFVFKNLRAPTKRAYNSFCTVKSPKKFALPTSHISAAQKYFYSTRTVYIQNILFKP